MAVVIATWGSPMRPFFDWSRLFNSYGIRTVSELQSSNVESYVDFVTSYVDKILVYKGTLSLYAG